MRWHLRLGLFSCVLLSAAAVAQPEPRWLNQFGTKDRDWATGLAPDADGGVFVSGVTQGSFGDPNFGSWDFFLARYDAAGKQLWATQLGTNLDDYGGPVAPDGFGGAFIAGPTQGSLGGPNAGNFDVALAHYDADGISLWIVQFGTQAADDARSLASDGAGGVFIGGYTDGDLGAPNGGGSEGYVAHYDSKGFPTWVKQFNNPGVVDGLASDGKGGVYAGGGGESDAFLIHFDANGLDTWTRQFGSPEPDAISALAPDGLGGVFAAGGTQGDLGGPGAGEDDIFIVRYDSDGFPGWVKQFGTSGTDLPTSLAPDGSGGIFVGGHTDGDLGAPNAGGDDVFVASFDGDGNQTWITQLGTSQLEVATGLASDTKGGAFVCGRTLGDLGGPNLGGPEDAFLARFALPCYADMNGNGTLDIFDFLWFINIFNANDPHADCDGNEALDLFDFLCFVNEFNAGC